VFEVSVGGLHFEFHGFGPSPWVACSPERPRSKGDSGTRSRHVIARLYLEEQVGGCFEVGEGHEQALEEQL
jgi:hypothetical protein